MTANRVDPWATECELMWTRAFADVTAAHLQATQRGDDTVVGICQRAADWLLWQRDWVTNLGGWHLMDGSTVAVIHTIVIGDLPQPASTTQQPGAL